jgi:abhydrolase domain-containing protein 6
MTDALVQQLHERWIDEQALRERWHLDAAWEPSGRFEAWTLAAGRVLYQQAMHHESRLYGFRVYRHRIEGFNVSWYANQPGKKHRGTLLLLHGLSAEKAHWLRFARYFVSDYQVIIPDLPAHGQTGYQAGQDYGTAAQARRLLALLAHIGIDRVHVMGNSMGGFIAARLAVVAPERVASLALFDAAGLQARTNSALEHALETGRNPFILHSVAEFDQLMAKAAVRPPWMPAPVRVMLARQYYERRERWFDVFWHLQNEIYPECWLARDIQRMTLPTLVLWGEQDGLLDVDMLDHFAELIPHAQTVRMPRTGHMPMMERPGRSAAIVRAFLRGLA